MLHNESVEASAEWIKRNLTLTVTLNLLLPSTVFHDKICVLIPIFMTLSLNGLFTAYFLYEEAV